MGLHLVSGNPCPAAILLELLSRLPRVGHAPVAAAARQLALPAVSVPAVARSAAAAATTTWRSNSAADVTALWQWLEGHRPAVVAACMCSSVCVQRTAACTLVESLLFLGSFFWLACGWGDCNRFYADANLSLMCQPCHSGTTLCSVRLSMVQ